MNWSVHRRIPGASCPVRARVGSAGRIRHRLVRIFELVVQQSEPPASRELIYLQYENYCDHY